MDTGHQKGSTGEVRPPEWRNYRGLVDPGVVVDPAGGGVLVEGSGEVVAGGGELGDGSGIAVGFPLGLLIAPGSVPVDSPAVPVELVPEPLVPFIVVPEPFEPISPGLLPGAVLLFPPIVPDCVPVWPVWLAAGAPEPEPTLPVLSAEPLPVA